MPLRTDRLKAVRVSRGLSQVDLARLCGLADVMIHRYEHRKVEPTVTTLLLIAEGLNVSTDYLLGLVDNPQATVLESDLKPEERDLVISYRRDGWIGVIRLMAERMGSK